MSPQLLFRLGGATGKSITEYHLSFEPAKVWLLSMGSVFSIHNTEIEFTGFYERLKPEYQNIIRENFFVMIQMTQWM